MKDVAMMIPKKSNFPGEKAVDRTKNDSAPTGFSEEFLKVMGEQPNKGDGFINKQILSKESDKETIQATLEKAESKQLQELSMQELLALMETKLDTVISDQKKPELETLIQFINENHGTLTEVNLNKTPFFSGLDMANLKSKPSNNIDLENLKVQIEQTKNIEGKTQTPADLLTAEELLQNILKQISMLIPAGEQGVINASDSSKLLKLLEKWASMEAGLKTATENGLIPNNLTKMDNQKVKQIWQQLTDTFEKRINMGNSSRYKAEATVTSADVAKWMKQALAKYSTNEQPEPTPVVSANSQAMPMTKIEQFTIHIQKHGSQEADNQKLMQEFEKILNSSRFIQSNGTKELLLKLNPSKLGEVTVRMIEVNGEMMVKMSVASQAAKDILEGNLSQLKHMFSPAQIMIEKQESNMAFQDSYQPEKNHEEAMDQSAGEEKQNGESSASDLEEANESTSFSEVLIAEKEQVST